MNPYICDKCFSSVKLWADSSYGEYLWKFCKTCGNYKWRKIKINTQDREVIREMSKHKFYSVPELAQIVERTPGMIRYWVLTGAIPFYKLGGRVLFRDSDIEYIKWYIAQQGKKRGVKRR